MSLASQVTPKEHQTTLIERTILQNRRALRKARAQRQEKKFGVKKQEMEIPDELQRRLTAAVFRDVVLLGWVSAGGGCAEHNCKPLPSTGLPGRALNCPMKEDVSAICCRCFPCAVMGRHFSLGCFQVRLKFVLSLISLCSALFVPLIRCYVQ